MTALDADAARSAELMGRFRRVIAEETNIEPYVVVSALMGVLANILADIGVSDADLDELTGTIPSMVATWRAKAS